MFADAAAAAAVACYSGIACGPEKERGDQIWEGSVAKVVRLRGVAGDFDAARLLRSQALERARKSPLDVGVACREHVLAVRDPALLQHGAHLDPLDAGVCAWGAVTASCHGRGAGDGSQKWADRLRKELRN